jgi:hypothetical protein
MGKRAQLNNNVLFEEKGMFQGDFDSHATDNVFLDEKKAT